MKKQSKRTLKNKLDKAFSQLVRARGFCDRCGMRDKTKLQCAHIYSRRYLSIRWNLLNAMCLCAGCHFWWHQNPTEGVDFIREKMGEDNYERLRVLRNEIVKYTTEDYETMLKNINFALSDICSD